MRHLEALRTTFYEDDGPYFRLKLPGFQAELILRWIEWPTLTLTLTLPLPTVARTVTVAVSLLGSYLASE